MIARWPFPERHLNINPDNFLSGTEYAASTVIKHHAFENSNDRPVQFVVCADFPTVDSASVSEIWKTVLENLLEMAIQPVTLTIADDLMVSYDSISGAMELAKHIQDTAKQAGQLSTLRASLYAKPIYLESDNLEGPKRIAPKSLKLLHAFHQKMRPGAL